MSDWFQNLFRTLANIAYTLLYLTVNLVYLKNLLLHIWSQDHKEYIVKQTGLEGHYLYLGGKTMFSENINL